MGNTDPHNVGTHDKSGRTARCTTVCPRGGYQGYNTDSTGHSCRKNIWSYQHKESYHNDTDIMITFTLKINPPEVNNGSTNEVSYSHLAYGRRIMGDRIGMFKVPFISPSDILAFEWVTETDCTNEGGIQEVGSVVFKKFDLPKEEDFFLKIHSSIPLRWGDSGMVLGTMGETGAKVMCGG